jgi:uncharacterized protein YbjT (DUF2867 family)
MILVTGATGNVGREVVTRLLERQTEVRVFTRDVGRVSHWGGRVEVARGSYADPGSFAEAVAGVEAIFLMNGSPSASEGFGRLVEAAKARSSPRIVLLSTCWAAPSLFADHPLEIAVWHRTMEDAIHASGLRNAILRPTAFMTNVFGWLRSIRTEGVVYNPFGGGKTAPIAPEDIAAVAVRALTDADFFDATLEVTGGELLTVQEQVDGLAKVLARPIRCLDVPVDVVVRNFMGGTAPPRLAKAIGESFEAVRAGLAQTLTDTVERVTGSRPMTFEAWTRKHAERLGQ